MDGDGKRDMITGHYWPGDIFIFAGEGKGEFGAMDTLKDESGRNLNAGAPWENEDEPRMESLSAAPYATDFDLDGDYDMLIGNIIGEIVLVENIGSAIEPRFTTVRRNLQAGGEDINVGHGDSGPVFVDWDGDGKRDLLSGAGDGSVLFFRNVGKDDAPVLAEAVALVAAGEDLWEAYPHGSEPSRPGARTKICVTDYDGDGRVDLLVGDYQSEEGMEPELDADQIALRDRLRAELESIETKINNLAGVVTDAEHAEFEALYERMDELYEELHPLEAQEIAHGFVWFYRRLPAKTL